MRIAILLLIPATFLLAACNTNPKPRVFVFTDINIDQGDPDDRQSLIHLLWYADELEIEGIVPDRWNAGGREACKLAMDAYEADFNELELASRSYPAPGELRPRIANNMEHALSLFKQAASDDTSPLYVLIWGNMKSFQQALQANPELSSNLRVLTIGTGPMLEKDIPHIPDSWEELPPCEMMNWNSKGRGDIYADERFRDMWWLEMNWSYNGMFREPGPAAMLDSLIQFGALGSHMKEVVKHHSWAQYFRVGDTPTVLYLLDPNHNPDDPTTSSWAGRYTRPFPDERPNYYTDFSGSLDWNYSDPCESWDLHMEVRNVAAATLEERRNEMYQATLKKLHLIYP